MLAVPDHLHAVDKNLFDTVGVLVWFFERCAVGHGVRIEHNYVCVAVFCKQAAAAYARIERR
jgi:hypothetical protein